MKKIWDLKKGFSNLELEGQGRGIIMGVTRLLLLGPFYTIQTKRAQTFWQECMPVASINHTNPYFFTKNIENCWFWKNQFFWVCRFWIFFQKIFFFCFIPMYISQRYHQGWVKILMITLFSSQKLPNPNISVPSAVYRIKLMTTNQKEQMRPRALFLLTRGFEFCVQPIKIT